MKYLLLPVFSFIGSIAASQTKYIGMSVMDKKSFEKIPGVTIGIPSIKKSFFTDNNGFVSIPLESADSITIVASAVGYAEDTFLLKEQKRIVNIFLDANSTSLGEVVVTGTLRPVQRTASPVPVEVYTPKFFLKNPTPSIFDALQLVNGVRPQLNCNVCSTGDIHINGLEGPYTMVLIDGMPIVSSLASVYGLSGIPNSLVERIEVVKGPASSLYGSEAIGGLINVITKNPFKAPLFSADISSTTWKEYNADIGLKYSIGKKAVSLLGVNYYNYSNPVDRNGDNFTDITLQNRISLFNKLSFQRGGNRTANLALRYVYEDRWGGEMNWKKIHRGGDQVYGENIYTSRFELIGNYQLPLKEKLFLSYSYNAHSQSSAYGTTIFDARQNIAFGQLTWDKTINDKHDLLAGVVSRYTFYDDNTTATNDTLMNVNRPDKILLPGIFIQDEIHLNENQKLLLGVRYDYDKRHGNIFTPRLAYKWSVSSQNIVRVNAGTGFRVVNLFTEDHAAVTGARAVVIRDKLKPERSYNVNVNYLKKIYTKDWWMNLDISAWWTYFTNRIVPDYETNPNQIIYANLNGYAVSKGLTVNTEMGFTNSLRGTIGATIVDVSIVDNTDVTKSIRKQQLLTERWSGTWTLSYTFRNKGFTIDYTGNIYGPMQLPLLSALDPRKSFSPVWSMQNIQLTWKISSGFELYGGIKNLLNWTPAKNNSFIIARAHDPFDKLVQFDSNGKVIATQENPYALTFDPTYVYAPNQGMRGFLGIRYSVNK